MTKKLIFARHETFHPRYSWIKKGFDEADADEEVFIRPDAHIKLGVGKNMVRSIRYWTHAFGVLKEGESPGRSYPSVPTDFGRWLLATNDGVDPYLEDLGSLWILHWRLLRGASPDELSDATAWAFTFFRFTDRELTSASLVDHFRSTLAAEYPEFSVAKSSLKKDATCILRMYGEVPRGKVSEESIQCPWAELGVLAPAGRSRTYQFRIGPKPGLSDEIVLGSCLDFMLERSSEVRTVSLGDLLHADRSPGLAFKLNEAALYGALERATTRIEGLELRDTAGIVQLQAAHDPIALRDHVFDAHYCRTDRQAEVAA